MDRTEATTHLPPWWRRHQSWVPRRSTDLLGATTVLRFRPMRPSYRRGRAWPCPTPASVLVPLATVTAPATELSKPGRGRSMAQMPALNLAAVVSPVQQSLALTRSTHQVAGLAVPLNLRDVPPDRLPSLDLACVLVRHTAAHVITAVPLEPAARIVGVNPALRRQTDSGWLASMPK